MPKARSEFVNYLLETLAPVGPISARAMFGGWGIYCDTIMFGLVADEELYLKVDDTSKALFEAEDCEPFTFTSKSGKQATMSYYRCPEQCFDEPEQMVEWGNIAVAAALRNAQKKAKNTRP